MAVSPPAPTRDDDPPHPNFDGIVFYPTTDKSGIVVTPASGQRTPPVSYLPFAAAAATAAELSDQIVRIRRADAASYLADYLEDMVQDLNDAIAACQPETAH